MPTTDGLLRFNLSMWQTSQRVLEIHTANQGVLERGQPRKTLQDSSMACWPRHLPSGIQLPFGLTNRPADDQRLWRKSRIKVLVISPRRSFRSRSIRDHHETDNPQHSSFSRTSRTGHDPNVASRSEFA